MTESLAEALGIDENDPMVKLAQALVEQDRDLITNLVTMRVSRGITVEQLAETLDWSVNDVRNFEAYFSDPKLSEIRRYAMGLKALVRHFVVDGSRNF